MQRLAWSRLGVLVGLLALAGAIATGVAGASTTASDAIPAKLTGMQNATPDAQFNSISCVSAGNCAGAGYFKDVSGNFEAFTQTETNGTWKTAKPAKFASNVENSTPSDAFYSISCVSAGDCTAAGYYRDPRGYFPAFTQTETGGTWHDGQPATFGNNVQDPNPGAEFSSVSCTSVGNCTAAGDFYDLNGNDEAFTQTEMGGAWKTAQPAKFATGVQNTTPDAQFTSVSCSSAGNCTAAGQFTDTHAGYQAFTQTETGGTWKDAQPAKFASGAQYTNPNAEFKSVSCVAAGSCTAAGYFTDHNGNTEAFTQTEVNGTWQTAQPAKFASGVQNANPYDTFNSVSCVSAGNCVAAGQFNDKDGHYEAFTQIEIGGTWKDAQPAKFATGVQDPTPNAEFKSVSCSSLGNCAAAGDFADAGGHQEAFTQTEVNGTWRNAQPARFSSGIQNNTPGDEFYAVSCGAVGSCTAAGDFNDTGGNAEAMTETVTTTRASITITSKTPHHGIVGKHPYKPTATATAGTVKITVASASRRICALESGRVTFKRVGTCTVLFDDPGNAYNVAAPERVQRISVINHPSAPRHATAVAGKQAALVKWGKPASDGGAKINRYILTSFPGHHHCKTRGKLRCTVKHLQDGTTYRFKIKAINAAGTGPASRYTRRVKPHS